MSVFAAEVAEHERTAGSLAPLQRELGVRDARVMSVDLYMGWYPGFDPSLVEGEAASLMRCTEEEVLRFASELDTDLVTLVAPFWGSDAPFSAVVDSLGRVTDRAEERGLRLEIEPSVESKVPTVSTALELIVAVNRGNLGLVIDTGHFRRSGGRLEDLDAVPLDRIFQIQLVDGPAKPVKNRFYDALHCRQFAGHGALDVLATVQRIASKGPLPPVGPEVMSDELSLLSPAEAARLSAEETRNFLRLVRVGS